MSAPLFDGGGDPAAPGVHALVVGASSYRYLKGGADAQAETFGMGQLTTAAASAWEVVKWLLARKTQLVRPLASLRVLLSPSAKEIAALGLPPGIAPATRENFVAEAAAWRDAARKNKDSATFFYFAGHGIQRDEHDAVILLDDMNRPGGGRMERSADTNTLFDGMSPSQQDNQNIARTQLYFVDACRIEPEEFMKLRNFTVPPIWDLVTGVAAASDRSAPFCYAALPGTAGEALEGQTLFSRALLAALDRAVGDPEEVHGVRRWPVTVWALLEALDDEMERVRRDFGGAQEYLPTGHVRNAVIQYLAQPPEFDVQVTVDPGMAAEDGRLSIADADDAPRFQQKPIDPHPAELKLALGAYTISVDFEPPNPQYRSRRIVRVVKRGDRWTVNVKGP